MKLLVSYQYNGELIETVIGTVETSMSVVHSQIENKDYNFIRIGHLIIPKSDVLRIADWEKHLASIADVKS